MSILSPSACICSHSLTFIQAGIGNRVNPPITLPRSAAASGERSSFTNDSTYQLFTQASPRKFTTTPSPTAWPKFHYYESWDRLHDCHSIGKSGYGPVSEPSGRVRKLRFELLEGKAEDERKCEEAEKGEGKGGEDESTYLSERLWASWWESMWRLERETCERRQQAARFMTVELAPWICMINTHSPQWREVSS